MTRIPANLLDQAVAGVLIDRRPVEHEAASVASLMLDRAIEDGDVDDIPPLHEIAAEIDEAVAAERAAIADRRYLVAEYFASRGVRP